GVQPCEGLSSGTWPGGNQPVRRKAAGRADDGQRQKSRAILSTIVGSLIGGFLFSNVVFPLSWCDGLVQKRKGTTKIGQRRGTYRRSKGRLREMRSVQECHLEAGPRGAPLCLAQVFTPLSCRCTTAASMFAC